MAAIKLGIVYAIGSKIIRRVIVPDKDRELDDPRHVGVGEAMLKVDRANITDRGAIEAAVLAATGIAPPEPRCAVCDDTGLVETLIAADPDLDVIAGKVLVLSIQGTPGNKVDLTTGEIVVEPPSTETPVVETQIAPL